MVLIYFLWMKAPKLVAGCHSEVELKLSLIWKDVAITYVSKWMSSYWWNASKSNKKAANINTLHHCVWLQFATMADSYWNVFYCQRQSLNRPLRSVCFSLGWCASVGVYLLLKSHLSGKVIQRCFSKSASEFKIALWTDLHTSRRVNHKGSAPQTGLFVRKIHWAGFVSFFPLSTWADEGGSIFSLKTRLTSVFGCG